MLLLLLLPYLSTDLTGDFDSPILRMSYTSLTTPSTVIDLHMATGERASETRPRMPAPLHVQPGP